MIFQLLEQLLKLGLPSMMTDGINLGGRQIDLSGRVMQTTTVIASPSGSAETVVATTAAFDTQLPLALGVIVIGELAYTLGTSAASCTVRLRRGTTTAGTAVYSTGAMTGGHNSAGLLVADSAGTFDTDAGAAQQYSVTLTVGSGAAASTVSAVSLIAIAI